MGCTPSIHVNPSGVVYCRSSEESPSTEGSPPGSRDANTLGGIQGHFRNTSELLDRDVHQLVTSGNLQNGSTFALDDDISETSVFFQQMRKDKERKDVSLKFGPMCLKLPVIKVLLIFAKDDAQTDALKWAAEKLSCDCTLVYTPEEAADTYASKHHHLVFIDSRQTKAFDPFAVCRSIHAIQGSQYSCLVAVVKKSVADKEDASVISFLKYGFNRWFVETYNLGICLNEIIQILHSDISSLIKLQATQALFTALDNCRDGVIVTSSDHDIQYVNKASEKLLGFPAEDLTGKNAQELCRAESVKADIVESINMQVKKGKEWEGTLFHKRKSGESIPLWSRILPIETYCGVAEHLVHVNECPFNGEKSYAADTSEVLPYPCNNVKPARKTSCDVRSLCSEAGLNRRQSFAKFHAMTLEPPITKVINMILATQEQSPLFVVQALDRVLDILRSAELYSPQFAGLHPNRPDDQVASDLFSGLISNSKSVFRRFSHENFKGYGPPPPPTPSSLPTLATAPPKVKVLLDHVNDWDFDIIQLEKITDRRPLIWVGMAICAKFNVCSFLNCEENVLRNWLSLIESNYHNNPYHNSTHAADVLQSTAYFLQKPRLKAILDPMDEVISLIAAVIHDVDHPGKNSAFLCNSGSELAILYNDLSVLESHHSALAFKLTMSNEKVNIFQNVNKETYKDMRQSIIDMVLATEMTKHFEHLSKFVNVFTKSVEAEDEIGNELGPSSTDLVGMATPENVVLVKRILIKCADVSNPARPVTLCKEWAYRIAEEYMAQTDEEKSRSLPIVMPAFDRAKCSIPKSQIGFIDYFVNDMFDAWDAFGDFPELIAHIRTNYEYWKEIQQQKELQQQEEEEDEECDKAENES